MSGCDGVEHRRPHKTSLGDGRPNGPGGDRPRKMREARFLVFSHFLKKPPAAVQHTVAGFYQAVQ